MAQMNITAGTLTGTFDIPEIPPPTPPPADADWVLDPKRYGAKGDGSDATDAIKACFKDAFGDYYAPHGGYGSQPGPFANKEVYFPAGHYRVYSSYTQEILGVTRSTFSSHGYDYPLIEVASTKGLRSTDLIYVRGSQAPSVNGCYGVEVVDDKHFVLWMAQYIEDAGAGGTATTPCLPLHAIQGGHIYGAGRISSLIESGSPNCPALALNGWGYGRMEALGISGAAGGIGLDYNWSQRPGDTVSSQSNTFTNMGIYGSDYGTTIGWGQAMCSETTWFQCYISGRTGVLINNYNALQHAFISGNIAACQDYGIHVRSGAAPTIINVGFQNYAGTCGPGTPAGKADIYIENGAGDAYAIIGVRTESPNFMRTGPSMAYTLIACGQQADDGFLYSGVGPLSLIGCNSRRGIVTGGGGTELTHIGCKFENPDWNQWYGPSNTIATTYRSLTGNHQCLISDGGTVFDNAEAEGDVTITLPIDQTELQPSINAGRLPPGLPLRFLVTVDRYLTIKCPTEATIRIGSSLSGKGGFLRSNVIGSFVELMAVDKGGYQWIALAREGDWTLDA